MSKSQIRHLHVWCPQRIQRGILVETVPHKIRRKITQFLKVMYVQTWKRISALTFTDGFKISLQIKQMQLKNHDIPFGGKY